MPLRTDGKASPLSFPNLARCSDGRGVVLLCIIREEYILIIDNEHKEVKSV